MKIQIDTTSKIIRIEETVLIGDFFELLDQLFPNLTWKEYSLQSQVITDWHNPIIVKDYPPVRPFPWTVPQAPITAMYGCPSVVTSGNIYNVQC